MSLRFGLTSDDTGEWASFLPVIGGWSDERLSIHVGHDGAGIALTATARPTSTDPGEAPSGPGIFALRWFECAPDDAEELVGLSVAAWPAFEAGTPGVRIFGLFRTDPDGGTIRFLLCTRYPSLSAWESSRADTGTLEFRRRAELTRRTQVSVWRLAAS